MPAKSKAQMRFMQAVAHGWKPSDGDISRAQAKEFVAGQGKAAYKKLPEKKSKKKNLKKEKVKKPGSSFNIDTARREQGIKEPKGPKVKEPLSPTGVRGTLIRSEQDQVMDLLKAFERRDDYTLVDPREFYGALQTVNKRVLAWVQKASEGLEVGESRDYSLPVKGATLKIRKIMGDMYSGWILDKKGDIEHLYDRLSLPALATQIMSVYEVYSDKSEPQSLRSVHAELQSINQELKSKKRNPKKLKNRLHSLIENLSNIDQMSIESNAKYEEAHNKLVDRTENELNNIHTKLQNLKDSVELHDQSPNQMTVSRVGRPGKCIDCGVSPCQCYTHLSKPTIEVMPNGKVTIIFKSDDWNNLDKANFLKSMKYVLDKKSD